MPIELKVVVIQAADLLNVESSLFSKDAKSDPYCKIEFRGFFFVSNGLLKNCSGKSFKTKEIPSNLNPTWGESFVFTLDTALDASAALNVEVFDKEKVTADRSLGTTSVPLGGLVQAVF
eukprot:Pompholyxophrys_punicea_v1_NODE_1129_length_926_cov_2.300804.p1 type:complete len:119 gc:universal NODE_1129_length_926_cov_2.300804:282-638(+)